MVLNNGTRGAGKEVWSMKECLVRAGEPADVGFVRAGLIRYSKGIELYEGKLHHSRQMKSYMKSKRALWGIDCLQRGDLAVLCCLG